MTSETPGNQENIKENLEQMSDAKLGSLYEHEKGSIMTEAQGGLKSLASEIQQVQEIDTVETEMTKRLVKNEKKELRELYFPENKEKNVDQATIDAGLMKLFDDRFHITLSLQDLTDLRAKLPIIDEIRDGKCFAYGEKGKSHAVQFDDFDITSRKDENGKDTYVFNYKVYVDVNSALSPEFRNIVTNTTIDFGQKEVGGHRFDVVLRGEPDYDPKKAHGKIPQISEVDPSDQRLDGKGGVIITEGDGSRTILIAQQGDKSKEASVIKHEISHLCGMVSEEPSLSQAPQDASSLLSATKETGVDDTKGERKEYSFLDLKPDTVLEKFDMNKQINDVKETLREKKIAMNDTTINIVVNGIKKYTGDRLPAIANEKDVGAESFLVNAEAAKACEEQIKTEIKGKFDPLLTVVSIFDQYPQLKASYQTNAQEFNFDTCCGLSQTLSNLVSSDQSLCTFLGNQQYLTDIENIKKEMKQSLDAKNTVVTHFETNAPSSPVAVDGKTFDTFDPKLQEYLKTVASPELLEVAQPQPTDGKMPLQDKVRADFIGTIKNKIESTAAIDTGKKEYVAEKYYEYLCKEGKISIPKEVAPKDADAYRTKFENGILTVEFGKKEEWEKEEKAPDTSGKKPEGILEGLGGMFGEAKQAFEKAMQENKGFFAAISAAIGVFFSGIMKFLGDKFGLKLTPDESAEKDVAASKAAFEKLGTGLTTPSDDWFKKDALTLVSKPSDGNWEKAWGDFYAGDVKNYTEFAKGKGTTDTGAILLEAKAFKDQTGEKKTMDVFYNERHKENAEKDKGEKIKDGVKQTWESMKDGYGKIALEEGMTFGITEVIETNGQPNKEEYKKKIEAVLGDCLGGIDGVKSWITKLDVKTLTMDQVDFLKTCKNNATLSSIQNLDWGKVKTAYSNNLPVGTPYAFDTCFSALKNLTTEQLQTIINSSVPKWPAPASK